jgi:hypothetical protein
VYRRTPPICKCRRTALQLHSNTANRIWRAAEASKDNFSGVLQPVLSDDADKKAAWQQFLGANAENGNRDAADLLKAANLK